MAVRETTGHISLKSFIQMISSTLDEEIKEMKSIIVKKIISLHHSNNISKRKYYYYYYYTNDFNYIKVNNINRKCLYLKDLFSRLFSKSRSVLSYDFIVEKNTNLTDFYRKTLLSIRNGFFCNLRPYCERTSFLVLPSKDNKSFRNRSIDTLQNCTIDFGSNHNTFYTNAIDINPSIDFSKSSKLVDDFSP